MTTSVIIPALNEPDDSLRSVIENLTDGIKWEDDTLEVIIVNDGSINSDGSPKQVKQTWDFPTLIINNEKRYGVGYSFDRGVECASGDTIVLMGADIYVERGKWLKSLLNAVKDDEIGCACSVGLQPGNYDITQEGLYHRYGAKILYTMGYDDLPKHSEFRKNLDYLSIIESKWLSKQGDEPYEIPCVYGACYWMKREQYLRIGGFDTKEGVRMRGHAYWGTLEAHLSLKARAYGLKCMMYPDIKAGHTFGRNPFRSRRDDYWWWNKLWVTYTLLDDPLKEEVLNHLKPIDCDEKRDACLSQAKAWIKREWATVQEVRQRNKLNGKLISK